MPLTTMYDAVDVAAIPADATMVAGYLDGSYVTWPELVRRFPHARKVSITTSGHNKADVIDVESGDATPLIAVQWVKWMRRIFRRPVVYVSQAYVSAVLQAFEADDAAPPFLWIADWTGVPHLAPGSVATQYSSPTTPTPSAPPNVDVSLVSPNWPDPVQTERHPVNIKLPNWSTIYRVLALVGAVLAYIVSIGNQLHLPASIRVALAAAASGIVWIEHHKVTAATPPKPPAPPANG